MVFDPMLCESCSEQSPKLSFLNNGMGYKLGKKLPLFMFNKPFLVCDDCKLSPDTWNIFFRTFCNPDKVDEDNVLQWLIVAEATINGLTKTLEFIDGSIPKDNVVVDIICVIRTAYIDICLSFYKKIGAEKYKQINEMMNKPIRETLYDKYLEWSSAMMDEDFKIKFYKAIFKMKTILLALEE